MPLVSVVIPAYNYARYLPDAIESVLSQTFADYEIIVIDDGSVDDTESVVLRYAGRLIYRKQENAGLAATRNRGCELAGGEYLAFIDADDVWHPDKLEKQIALLQRNPDVGMVTGMMGLIDVEGRSLPGIKPGSPPGETFGEMLNRGTSAPSTFIVRKTCFEDVGGFDATMPSMEDLDFGLRVAARHRVICLPDIVGQYRTHLDSMSHQSAKVIPGFVRVYEKCLDYMDDPALVPLVRRKLARYRNRLASFCIKQGDLDSARSNLRAAIATSPLFGWGAGDVSPWIRPVRAIRPYVVLSALVLFPGLVRKMAGRAARRPPLDPPGRLLKPLP